MQSLEVSGAIRPLCGSLGVKGLIPVLNVSTPHCTVYILTLLHLSLIEICPKICSQAPSRIKRD